MYKVDILLFRIINVSVMSMGKYYKWVGDKMIRCLIWLLIVIENYYDKSIIIIFVIDLIFYYIL